MNTYVVNLKSGGYFFVTCDTFDISYGEDSGEDSGHDLLRFFHKGCAICYFNLSTLKNVQEFDILAMKYVDVEVLPDDYI